MERTVGLPHAAVWVVGLMWAAGCPGGSSDIPPDPNVDPPPLATGPLSPSVTLGAADEADPDRVTVLVGGVGYTSGPKGDGPYVVVQYDDENLTLVVDGKVQGKLIGVNGPGLKADLAFIIDNTSSMGEEIAGVRDSILAFLGEIDDAGQDIRAGIVAFGDEINQYATEVPDTDTYGKPAVYGFVDLGADVSESGALYQLAEALFATDPGTNFDYPELGLAGVDFARRTFSWREDAQRIYIVVTDDTSWGQGYPIPNNKGIDEDYFTSETLGALIRDEGSVVHVVSPDYSYFPPVPPEYDMRDLATLTGGIWRVLEFSGAFDLTQLGIIETTLASTLVTFERDDHRVKMREVRVHVSVDDEGRTVDGERTVALEF